MKNQCLEIISEIMNLKQRKRSGWIIQGRELDAKEVESVSDHSWAASMLALLFLPETIELKSEKNNCKMNRYNKNKIIAMLIVHDLAESYLGDIPFGHKTEADRRKERERFDYYLSLGKYNLLANLCDVNELWNEFEKRKTINAKIAKDIDQIESFIQLNIYKEKLIARQGENVWKALVDEWFNNITIMTNTGRNIFNIVMESFYVKSD